MNFLVIQVDFNILSTEDSHNQCIQYNGTNFSMQVDKKLFEQALLKLNREEFVEIFLDHGFLIHKYLNHKKYKLLYEKADDREFFVSICQEKVLGQIGVSTCYIATITLTPEVIKTSLMGLQYPIYIKIYRNNSS